jgi:prepilin-type N-terminal cleavage/methylation domain-containing protein
MADDGSPPDTERMTDRTRPARSRTAPRRRGFSLIEILVAMLFVAILAAIALPKYRDMKKRSFVAMMKNDLGQLRVAEEGFWAEHQQYTTDLTQLDFTPTSAVTLTVTSSDLYAGYDAAATHISIPNLTCQMYVGRVVTGTPSGDIVCK